MTISISEWSELQKQLTDPTTRRLSPARIDALTEEQRSAVVNLLIQLKQDVIVQFVTSWSSYAKLTAMGYESGWKSPFYDYYILPTNQLGYKQGRQATVPAMPVQTPAPASEPASKTAIRKKKQSRIDTDNPPAHRQQSIDTVMSQIRTLRTEQQMTQLELGEAIGMSKQHVTSHETGRFNPTLGTLADFAHALGYEITGLKLRKLKKA